MVKTSAWLVPGLMSVTVVRPENWEYKPSSDHILLFECLPEENVKYKSSMIVSFTPAQDPVTGPEDLYTRILQPFSHVPYEVMSEKEINMQGAPGVQTELIFALNDVKLVQIVKSVFLNIENTPMIFDISASSIITQAPKVIDDVRQAIDSTYIEIFSK